MQKRKAYHFNLFPLFAFVAERPMLPPFLAKNEKRKSSPYREAAVKLLNDAKVSERGGWYLWGKFNEGGWWESSYIGMASHRKNAGLFIRLRDELREECAAMFATVYGRAKTVDMVKSSIKKHVRIHGGKDYSNSLDRSLRKVGSQFVIWIKADDGLTDEEIRTVEHALMSIYRPTFNVRGMKNKMSLQEAARVAAPYTTAIDQEIGDMIGGFDTREWKKADA